ncbi:HesA/MoeB/ThiF family protein [Halothiobacillus sp.]|jgi:adenylyltransferase/sulfurtransferase|uniref:HesA/MoeB/ThiF family protein n=1 Tax=Halothiobacillus sp. TaxID=1891311 RepID=UPI0026139ED4|nr:molybdopterin-synthase adenylyltransferase MoeB [Halothiobacillus sp.]MDD3577176.1 molybdopterin-synthase adenylyltransferase MoeB [Halothiobacillus sp.]MDD4965830.1 molybdopterin-synthase adenylyltransferase MoeB [Halothiobacillus sp.]
MNDEQLLRYSRHIMLPEIDYAGQERLRGSRVLIAGLGGLGSPVALYLAAAGVGELVLADFDAVDLSNLQRQVIHDTASVGLLKIDSAARRIAAINPDVKLRLIHDKLTKENLPELLADVDLVCDCSDNFALRFALNAACVDAQKPLVSGAAIRMEGQVTVFDTRLPESPCYHCLYQEEGEDALRCSETGVLSPLVGMIGSVQASEAIKILAGFGDTLVGRLALFDLKRAEFRTIRYRRDPDCPVCKNRSTPAQ